MVAMFEPSSSPRVFALPPGVDFPKALLDGLIARHAGQPPEALARVRLVVNTRRMARRLRDMSDAGPARLLPRIMLLTDLAEMGGPAAVPPAVPALRRRLELAELVRHLLDREPDLAARSTIYDLADSLAELMDEMQGEGVTAETIHDLDVASHSAHWARAQKFVSIAESYIRETGDTAPDAEARQRRIVEDLIADWEKSPPADPIILAGSTGSRGTTLMLMQAVARLPQGALILPGFDFDLPDAVWTRMDTALRHEDHPQFRFRRLMQALDLTPDQIGMWDAAEPASGARNRLVSLALRPAPVTDAWMREGPHLTDIAGATQAVSLLEAENPRAEALAIALRLRAAAETGQTAALITPDRMLTRQVAAALDRWDILPDDSAGQPLHLSPPGRFLRHVAALFTQRLTGEHLLTLLKHPLTHGGADRGDHLRFSRDLELHLRRHGPAFPDAASMALFGGDSTPPGWLAWLIRCFCDRQIGTARPLTDWVTDLRSLAEAIAAGTPGHGSGLGSGMLWSHGAGQKANEVIVALEAEAAHGGQLTGQEFGDLLASLLSGEEVRDPDTPRRNIMIWGTLEARVQGADLLILGGLNEGTWPEAPAADPWLNREMRDQAGLLLPDRRIGLSAHDFQQAIAAPEVWLTRPQRSDDAETVPSRWLNRLVNLLDGLPDQGGRTALKEMRNRGSRWLNQAALLDAAPPVDPAPRPSPSPPVIARPRKLSVTEIKRLIRDPYAIYARHVLRLRPLDPLVKAPDALLRGTLVHGLLEKFVRDSRDDPALLTPNAFLERARRHLRHGVPWPSTRRLWLARLERIAERFVQDEAARRLNATPTAFEVRGRAGLDPLDFTLSAVADRIDRATDGSLVIYDYKTGRPPTAPQQAKFDKQLLLEAAMAENGAFEDLEPERVSAAVFLGVGTDTSTVAAPLDSDPPAQVWEDLKTLIGAYLDPNQGFTSRLMVERDAVQGDYDQLARFGEWDRTTPATRVVLT